MYIYMYMLETLAFLLQAAEISRGLMMVWLLKMLGWLECGGEVSGFWIPVVVRFPLASSMLLLSTLITPSIVISCLFSSAIRGGPVSCSWF